MLENLELPGRSFGISYTYTDYILIVVYVNDIVITRDDSGGIARLKQFWQQRDFTQRIWENYDIFLGLKISDK